MNTFFKSSGTLFDTVAAAAILVSILATGSAIVGESLAARQTIKFQQSDLGTPAGVATLYGDIRSAALQVCTAEQPRPARMDQVQTCTRQAEAQAVRRVNVDALTAYFRSESQHPAATFASNRAG
jgi:UrcA family protein